MKKDRFEILKKLSNISKVEYISKHGNSLQKANKVQAEMKLLGLDFKPILNNSYEKTRRLFSNAM